MRIGIVGTGNMGRAIGVLWAKAGHEVLFSHSRDPGKLDAAARQAGPSARTGSPAEAARFGDALLFAVAWPAVADAAAAVGAVAGKVVITCVSPLQPDFTGAAVGMPPPPGLDTSAAERLAAMLVGARVVESFNLTFAETLASPDRGFGGERPSLPYCGDDAGAKATAAALIRDCGYDPLDAGGLAAARSLELLASAWVQFAVASRRFPHLALRALTR